MASIAKSLPCHAFVAIAMAIAITASVALFALISLLVECGDDFMQFKATFFSGKVFSIVAIVAVCVWLFVRTWPGPQKKWAQDPRAHNQPAIP